MDPRLETGTVAVQVEIASASEIVRRALDDANTLIRSSGPQSAVDRVHTALHGYLHSLCDEVGIDPGERPTMNQLFKALHVGHPALANLGPRSDDIRRILGSMAAILDALNPVRNNASVAHPNNDLVGEPEAYLVINTVRTLLGYFELRRKQYSDTSTPRNLLATRTHPSRFPAMCKPELEDMPCCTSRDDSAVVEELDEAGVAKTVNADVAVGRERGTPRIQERLQAKDEVAEDLRVGLERCLVWASPDGQGADSCALARRPSK